MSKNIDRTKTVARFVIGISAGRVINTVLRQQLPTDDLNRLNKAQVVIGSYIAGAMVADAAESWSDRTIDKIVEAWNDSKNNIDNP